jgi:hypothetical protein
MVTAGLWYPAGRHYPPWAGRPRTGTRAPTWLRGTIRHGGPASRRIATGLWPGGSRPWPGVWLQGPAGLSQVAQHT